MKTLYFLRHAKSDWSDYSLPDHDRPLNARGRRACIKIGRLMQQFDIQPDLVLCSTAVRAQETLERVMTAGTLNWQVQSEGELYGAGADRILSFIRQQPDVHDSLLFVGHNPGFQDLVVGLSGTEAQEGLIARAVRKLPTGAFAEIRFDEPGFQKVGLGGGHLERLVKPKDKTMV